MYSTYLPLDVFDARHNLAVDAAGNAYVAGTSFQMGDNDEFLGNQITLLKLSPDGSQLLLGRHVGGVDSEKATAVTIDGTGNIYLTGMTEGGESFPVTAGAHQPVCGDIFYNRRSYCYRDGVLVVLNSSGQLVYSSHHGGSFTDEPQAIATDGQGNIVIAGNTTSGEFPLVQPLQASCPLDSTNSDCRSPRGFVSAIHLEGGTGTLTYSTYLGASEQDSTNVVLAAAIDGAGNATVTGYTNGRQFPLLDPVQAQLHESFCTTLGSQRLCFDAFVVTFTPAGGLSFGSYLGGAFDEFPYDVVLNGSGSIYVAGMTEADNFPVTADAFQLANLLGDDGFIVRLGSAGTPPPPPPAGDHRVFLPTVIR